MVDVQEVNNTKLLNQFIELPFQLYKSDSSWVPYLKSELKKLLDCKKNPFWRHARGKLYIASRNGQTLGRIAAIVDDNFIKFHSEASGYFGFFESIDDREVASALFQKAVEFHEQQGMSRFYGPMNPSTNEECGFLLEGFETPPFIMMTHTPKYYLELAECFGFKKARDLFAYYIDLKEAPLDYLARLTKLVMKRLPNLTVRPVNMSRFEQEVKLVKEVYNDAWSKNWGFVPLTDAEIDDMAKKLKALIIPELILIAEITGEPVGVSLAVPNYNQVLKHLNGRFGPIEIVKFLYYKNKITEARLMIMGTKKQYRKMGIESFFFYESFRAAKKLGYKGGELSWILEDNDLTNRPILKMGGKMYKKYRIVQYDIKKGDAS